MNWDWISAPPEAVSLRKWFAWGLLLVFIYSLQTAIFWHRLFIDTEAWALYIAGLPFAQQMAQVRADLVHPPLMCFVQRGWLAAFGQTDSAARALPLAIVPPTILLLTLLATRITAHWRLLSFFLVTPFFQVNVPQLSVRMYGLALLLTVSALLLWDNWRANPRNLALASWTAVMTALVYTHLFGLLILFSFVVLNWMMGRRKIAFTLAAAIPGIAFLPWIFYVLPIYRARGLEANLSWVHQNLLSAIPTLFFSFLSSFQFNSYRLGLAAIGVSTLIHLGLLALGWRNRARFWPPRAEAGAAQRWFWAAFILAGLPVLMLLAFSIVKSRAFEARFVLGASLPYAIALFLLCQLSGRAGRIFLLCVLLPWRIGAIADKMYISSRPAPVRASVEFVAARARAGDLLLMDDPNHSAALYWDWVRRLRRTEPIEVLPDEFGRPLRIAVLNPRPIESIDLAGFQRIWVFQGKAEDRPGLAEALAARGFMRAPRSSGGTPMLNLYERKIEP